MLIKQSLNSYNMHCCMPCYVHYKECNTLYPYPPPMGGRSQSTMQAQLTHTTLLPLCTDRCQSTYKAASTIPSSLTWSSTMQILSADVPCPMGSDPIMHLHSTQLFINFVLNCYILMYAFTHTHTPTHTHTLHTCITQHANMLCM